MFPQLVALVVLFANYCDCAKILAIFPTPSISHQVVYRALTSDLIKSGHHQLTILTPNPTFEGRHPNVTEVDLSSTAQLFHKLFNYAEFKDLKNDEISFVRKATTIFERIMNEQLSHPQVKDLIAGRGKYEFDLMIMEHTGYIPMLAFAEIYDCPVIGITSFEAAGFTYQAFGSDWNPVVLPEQNLPFVPGELTFGQRFESLKSTVKLIFGILLPPSPLIQAEAVLTKHFPSVSKGLFQLLDRVELLMVNAHPALGFVRPLVPNTIQLGFMHIEPPKELQDEELKSFLEASQSGVIYMSFGSNIRSKDLGEDAIKMFVNVFKKSKYDVIWKFEGEMTDKPRNVFIQKWLPQADLLAHPKIKLFITQGGQQSVEEAIDRTVPMIVVPFLGDQPGMAAKLQHKGVGRYIDLENMTESYLTESIDEMVKPVYKENVKHLRELVYDQPMTSREKAVWWTEYVIRHKGAKHLAYPGRLVPFYQRYCLDFLAIVMLSIYVTMKLIKRFLKLFESSEKVKDE